MDENGSMNLRNWGFLEAPSVSSYLGLQLMLPASEKPLLEPTPQPATANTITGPFHHHHPGGISDPHAPYWINNDQPYYHSSYGISSAHSLQIPLPKNENAVSKAKEKSSMKRNVEDKGNPQHPPQKEKKPRIRAPKKRAEIEINGSCMDISDIPTPVCSCTGSMQQCYRWGSGGWQSACCTMGMSVYPLPMSTKRRGARIAGRKMSIGAFKKVLEKLTKEGYDFLSPIDLKGHWAKHGTNKFVTIR